MHEDRDASAPGGLFTMRLMNAEEPKLPLPAHAAAATSPAHAPASPQWQSEQLLQGSKEVLIHHGEEVYRLRLTRQGKLILYK